MIDSGGSLSWMLIADIMFGEGGKLSLADYKRGLCLCQLRARRSLVLALRRSAKATLTMQHLQRVVKEKQPESNYAGSS